MKNFFTKPIYFIAAFILFVGATFSAAAQTYTVNTIGTNTEASAVAKDAAGNVYVIESVTTGTAATNGKLLKYAAGTTSSPTTIYTGSLLPDRYAGINDNYAFGLVVASNGDIYFTTASDYDNNKNGAILKIAYNGGAYGTPAAIVTGTATNGLFSSLAIDASDNLYTIRYNASGNGGASTNGIPGAYEGVKYSSSGTFLSSFASTLGTAGFASPDQYSAVKAIAVNPINNDVYLADNFNINDAHGSDGGHVYRIQQSSGNAVSTFTTGTYASSLAFDPSGNLYAAIASTRPAYQLVKYAQSSGVPTTSTTQLYTSLGSNAGWYPFGIVYVSGNIFVSDGGNLVNSNHGNFLQLIGAPTTAATNVTFSNIATTSATVSWTNGNGNARAVFMKNTNTGQPTPVNSTTYTANTAFQSGSQIGATGWYCIYNGTGTTVNVTALTQGQSYQVMAVEYNGPAGAENYLQTTGTNNPNTFTTISPTTINSLTRVNGSITNLATVNYSAVFGSAVTGVTASNFSVTTTGVSGVSNASIGTPTTSDNITWSVPVSTGTGDGTIQLNLANATGLSKTISTSLPFAGQQYTIDKTSPTVTISAPSVTRANSSTDVVYTVTWADANINAATETLSPLTAYNNRQMTGTAAVNQVQVSPISGNQATVTFRAISGDGTFNWSLPANSASDLAGNQATAGATPSPTVTIDNSGPTVTIARSDSNPIADNVLDFHLTFNEATTGVDPTDFTLTTTGGIAYNSPISVTDLGDHINFNVTVTGVTGTGTARLDLIAGGVTDDLGNVAPANTSGEVYDVDQTAPVVNSITRVGSDPTNATSVDYTVTFSEPVSNVDASDFTVTKTLSADGSVTNVTGTGDTRTVTVSSVTGNGTLQLDLNNSGTGITDALGNAITTGFTSGETYTIDNSGPVASGLAYSSNNANPALAKVGDVLTVSFNAGETIPTPSITISGHSVTATDLGGNAWSGSYTLIAGDTEGDQPFVALLTDALGNTMQYDNSSSPGFAVTFQKTPLVTSVTAPVDGTYGTGGVLSFTVNFGHAVNVTNSPVVNFTMDSGAKQAAYASGTGTSSLVFHYEVVSGDMDADGIAIDNLALNGGTIIDGAGNTADITLNSIGTTTGVLVDAVPPVVSSIALAGASPTNATSVDYTVTFSKSVIGVQLSDFSLTKTGTADGSATAITGSGTTYTVTVSSVTGDGTLRLDLNSGAAIYDDNSNQIAAGFTGGDAYTIDQTAPVVNSITRVGSNPTNATSVDYTVTFSEPVLNVDQTDFTVIKTASAQGSVSGITGSGDTYTVTVGGVSGNGDLRLDLNSSGTGITDAIGNAITTGFTAGQTYTIDTSDPAIVGGSYQSNNGNPSYAKLGDIITLSYTGLEPLQPPVVTIAGHSVAVTNPAGNFWTSSYTMLASDTEGPTAFTLDIYDLAGNHKNYNSTDVGLFITYDTTHPAITIGAPSVAGVGVGNSVSYNVTYSDANFSGSTLTTSDVAIKATGDANGTIGVSGAGANYVVTISNVTGTPSPANTVGFSIVAGTATDQAGNLADTVSTQIPVPILHSDATLSALTTALRKVAPNFNPATTAYTIFIPYTATGTTITATVNEPGATLQARVNGGSYIPVSSGIASDPLALDPGTNTIDVLVTAEDGVATQTYTITATRQHSGLLTSLNFSPSLIKTQVPGSNFVDYTGTVSSMVSAISVIPVTQDPTSTITVNGAPVNSGDTSDPITLNPGQTTINTVVTTSDAVSKTYSIVITRQADALLSSITYNPGLTLHKVAGTHDFDYTATVKNSSITVTPVANDAAATIEVNGQTVASGNTSDPIALAVGANTITTVVTATDGTTTKSYSVVVTREANALLATLAYSPPSLKKTKVAGSNYVDYVATVDPSVTATAVTPVAQDPTSTITVNGVTVASGATSDPIALAVGNTTINTVVTAADGTTTNTYSIVITRTANALLSSLTYSPGLTVTKVAGSHDFDYTAKMSNSSIMVMPVTADAGSTVTVNGAPVTSGTASDPIALAIGDNVINTVVTASDGVTTKTYSITITRQPNALLATLAYSPASIRKVKVAGTNYVDYTSTVKNTISEVTVTPVVQDATSTVTVNGTTVASGATSDPIALVVGDNTINTVVTASDGTTSNTYSIVITRQGPISALMVYEAPKELPIEPVALVVHQNVSPNGDGRSDGMLIEGIAAYPDNKLQIMNRSGNLVYETKGYDNSTRMFDGHANDGKLQQAGTYFYSLEYKVGSETKRKTGYIVLKY